MSPVGEGNDSSQAQRGHVLEFHVAQPRVPLQQPVDVLAAGGQDGFVHLEGLGFGGDGEITEELVLAHLVQSLQEGDSVLQCLHLCGRAVEAV